MFCQVGISRSYSNTKMYLFGKVTPDSKPEAQFPVNSSFLITDEHPELFRAIERKIYQFPKMETRNTQIIKDYLVVIANACD